MQRSLRVLGLSVADHPKEEAERIFLQSIGLIPSPESNGDIGTLSWLRTDMLNRLEAERRRKGTIREYRIALDHLIAVLGPEYRVKDIKKSDWLLVRTRLLDIGNSPATVNKTGRHLRGVFSRLVDDGLIDRNPFAKFARIEEQSRHTNVLSRDELKTFLVTVENSENAPGKKLAQILALTGRRRIEILTLRRDDIDLVGGKILVMNAKHRQQRKMWVPIPDDEIFLYDGTRHLFSVRGNIAWFLENRGGEEPLHACHPNTLSRWIKAWLIEIGRGDLHAHDLRHTYITLLGEHMELWKVQRLVDHSTINVTEGYFHKTAEHVTGLRLGLGEID